MMNFLIDCQDKGIVVLLRLVNIIIDLIKFGIPILLIIFGMLDLGKAVMAGKEDEMKKAQGTLIKRVIYAVAVFLVVVIVQLVMGIVADAKDEAEDKTWIDCLTANEV